MKKKIISILLGILAILGVGGGGYAILGGGGQDNVPQTLAGTASQLCLMPNAFVEASATTTNLSADGCAITQELDVDGVTELAIGGYIKGGTATTTFSIRPYISQDGITFYPVTGSSTSTDQTGTTTIAVVPKDLTVDPGTATTSFALSLNIPSATKLRLLMFGDDLTSDATDGIKAFIQVGLKQGY